VFSNFRLLRFIVLGFLAAGPLAGCAQTKDASSLANAAQKPESPHMASAVPKPERPLPTLHDMIGLDRNQVSALLGEPRFRRHDQPADLWQYSNKNCALDLFLYRIRDGIIYKVTHADVRILNGAKVTENDCFKKLIKHHIDQVRNGATG
jgi:hypothetical protein